ncbi:hypothetical protein L2E82_11822 [Cichorium intybus]|uniref:Uncharacterized protein n=1 Tax=Cichorium intybus TaxID=13427 RepID=A0ACB9GFK4_CICIN|nr:hypothetical protein L2E82_11822 [Cichorium intybus]
MENADDLRFGEEGEFLSITCLCVQPTSTYQVIQNEMMSKPDLSVEPDPELPLALLHQKEAGKRLLLIANSDYIYTDKMMRHSFNRFLPNDMNWRDLFEMACPGGLYSGGSAQMVANTIGIHGDEILYVGDHSYTHVSVSKVHLRWRTALICVQLEEESFKDLVAACLVKDPKKRPSSEKLLKHPFFKNARTTEYLENTLLNGLSQLGDRFRMLKAKEVELFMQNKELYGEKQHLSQQEYIRGISACNFDLEDLKNQAALIQDYDEISNTEEPNANSKQQNRPNDVGLPAERLSPDISDHSDNGSHHEVFPITFPNTS